MRPIPGTITDPAMDAILRPNPSDPPPPRKFISLGEQWLRAKVEAHGPEEFHKADPQLVRAATKDLLLDLDACRS